MICCCYSSIMSDDSPEWLLELLQEVQLQQFYGKLRDDLQVTRSVILRFLSFTLYGLMWRPFLSLLVCHIVAKRVLSSLIFSLVPFYLTICVQNILKRNLILIGQTVCLLVWSICECIWSEIMCPVPLPGWSFNWTQSRNLEKNSSNYLKAIRKRILPITGNDSHDISKPICAVTLLCCPHQLYFQRFILNLAFLTFPDLPQLLP